MEKTIDEELSQYDVQKYIDRCAKKYKNKKILLYGAGLYAERIIDNYDISKLNIVGITDRKYENEPKKDFNGIKTFSPKDIGIEFDVIILTVKYYKNFEKVVKKDYFKNKRVKIEPLIKPSLLSNIITITEE